MPIEIDRLNIYQATKQAMMKIASSLDARIVLTDAMPFEIEGKHVEAIIKGDSKSVSIAAASILAKVTRDRLMMALDKQYPQYHFAKHKGYPTKEHIALIEQYGICEAHRLSYKPVQKVLGKSFE